LSIRDAAMVDNGCLDPNVARLLKFINLLPDVSVLSPQNARRLMEIYGSIFSRKRKPDNLDVSDHHFSLGRRILRCRQYKAGDDCPHLIFLHGGGGVVGSIKSYNSLCMSVAALGKVNVISVDYPLAPETNYEQILDFIYISWQKLVRVLGCKVQNGLALMGDSAGGLLAIELCRRLVASGAAVPDLLVLIYPWISQEARNDCPSRGKFGKNYILTEDTLNFFGGCLGRPQPFDLIEGEFSNLPPTLVYTAGFDPLRDEGLLFCKYLRAAGVPVEYREFDGLIHGFCQLSGIAEQVRSAICEIAARCNKILNESQLVNVGGNDL